MKQIIILIAARQQELKLSNRKMAIAADITPGYYAQIIEGSRAGVSYEIIQSLANYVGLELLAVYNPALMSINEREKKIEADNPITPSVKTE